MTWRTPTRTIPKGDKGDFDVLDSRGRVILFSRRRLDTPKSARTMHSYSHGPIYDAAKKLIDDHYNFTNVLDDDVIEQQERILANIRRRRK